MTVKFLNFLQIISGFMFVLLFSDDIQGLENAYLKVAIFIYFTVIQLSALITSFKVNKD